MNKNVLILTDPTDSGDTPDSIDNKIQADNIECALKLLNYNTAILSFETDIAKLSDKILKGSPEIVFNLVEDERYIYYPPAILTTLEIKYTGGSPSLFYNTNSKTRTKMIIDKHKPASFRIPHAVTLKGNLGEPSFPSDYIIKPVSKHGSFDITVDSLIKADSTTQVTDLLKFKSHKNGIEYFAEQYIDGREFNIGYLNGKVLPFAEIVFKNYRNDQPKIVDYRAKWIEDSFEYNSTVREFNYNNKEKLEPLLQKACEEIINIFQIDSFVRLDFRVTEDFNIYLLEVNVNPCLSPDGGFFAACCKAGFDYKTMIQTIIKETIQKT